MRKIELEAWVLEICDRVVNGGQVEDDRVELKRVYLPDRQDEARRIAALCNSARSDHAVWLVGVDEKAREVPGAPSMPDPADWLTQLESHWPDLAPGLLGHLGVRYGDVSVVAYLFDASRAPYTVKVTGEGKVDREVPVRSGTRTRSARREDLVRMVVPAARKPVVEVLSAEMQIGPGGTPDDSGQLGLHGVLWIENVNDRLYVPSHTCSGEIIFSESGTLPIVFELFATDREAGTMGTIHEGDGQLIIEGPGTCGFAERLPLVATLAEGEEAEVVLSFILVGGERVTVQRLLYLEEPIHGDVVLRRWGTGPGC